MLFFSQYNPIIQSKTLKIRLSSLKNVPRAWNTVCWRRPVPYTRVIEYIGLGAEKHTISISNEVMPIET